MNRGTLALLLVTLVSGSAQAQPPVSDETVLLFDGTSLAGWRGYRISELPAGWSVVDGTLQGDGTGPDLITSSQYADFELTFEWRMSAGGNSGVIYRATETSDKSHQTGLEYQLVDETAATSPPAPTQGTGAVYGLYGAVERPVKPLEEFNESRIIARGNHIEHWLNGTKTAECELGSEDWQTKLAASKFSAWPEFARAPAGHIALQSHGHSVSFRNLRLRVLVTEPADDSAVKD